MRGLSLFFTALCVVNGISSDREKWGLSPLHGPILESS